MRIGIVLLATSLAIVALPIAAADEGHPDCEANQPWIGYTSTTALKALYEQDLGSPAGHFAVCEGEHWDGQDTVQPTQAPSCNGSSNADPNNLFVGLCMGADPNTMPGEDPLNPLGLRVSSKGGNEAYVAANIALVGRAVVYADEGTASVYIRDNTPGNVLATVVSAPRVTQGFVSEADCDQATYQAGAENPPSGCGRDNTAITVEHSLLA